MSLLVIDSKYRSAADFGICGVGRLKAQLLNSLPYRPAMMEEVSLMLAIRKLQFDCEDETSSPSRVRCVVSRSAVGCFSPVA